MGSVMTGDFLNVQRSRLEPAWRRRRVHLAQGEQASPALVMEKGTKLAFRVVRDNNWAGSKFRFAVADHFRSCYCRNGRGGHKVYTLVSLV